MIRNANTKENCDGMMAKLKKECNIVGKSMDKMKEFSNKNKTIGQSLGISNKDGKKKSLKDISKENKTIDQTYKNISLFNLFYYFYISHSIRKHKRNQISFQFYF